MNRNHNNFFTRIALVLCSLVLIATPTLAFSATIVTSTNTTPPATNGYSVSAVDLLEGLIGTATPNAASFQLEGRPGVPALTDGTFGVPGDAANGTGQATAGEGQSLLYTLPATPYGLGYSISGVDTYAGWSYGRFGQTYDLSFHQVGDAPNVFSTPIVVNYPPGAAPGTTNNTAVFITDLGISNVDQVLFTFHAVLDGIGNSYSGYRELDVFGAIVPPPAPEPSTALLLGLGLVAFAVRKRKQGRG